MKNSKIEWCEHTFNPWIGCTKVSPACDNCYAEALMDNRLHVASWGAGRPRVRTSARNWSAPRRWNAEAEVSGTRPFVFCSSLADVFDNEVETGWRAELFQLIENTPQLVWLLLTKRVGNVPTMLAELDRGQFPANAALGATMASQSEYDRDNAKLFWAKSELKPLFTFGSFEPLLGPVYLDSHAPDWIIVGGESGPNARPMHPGWPISIMGQCKDMGRTFMFKQWGEWLPFLSAVGLSGDDLHRFPDGQELARVGRKNAGNMLLGKTRLDRPCV